MTTQSGPNGPSYNHFLIKATLKMYIDFFFFLFFSLFFFNFFFVFCLLLASSSSTKSYVLCLMNEHLEASKWRIYGSFIMMCYFYFYIICIYEIPMDQWNNNSLTRFIRMVLLYTFLLTLKWIEGRWKPRKKV